MTATLGLVAGGASGIVAMGDELGGDGRLVAFMRYLRVLVVVRTAPLVVDLLLLPGTGGAAAPAGGAAGAGLGADLAFTAGCTSCWPRRWTPEPTRRSSWPCRRCACS